MQQDNQENRPPDSLPTVSNRGSIFCPRCGRRTMWFNQKIRHNECLNPACKAIDYSDLTIKGANPRRPSSHSIPGGFKAIVLIVVLSAAGFAISRCAGSFVPLGILLGFALLFSIENWSGAVGRNHKTIGIIYRLVLNLGILTYLGFVIWSGVALFSSGFATNLLAGSLIFLAECISFFWFLNVVDKNSWRSPSMKLTFAALIGTFLIFAYAGVQPVTAVKDAAFSFTTSFLKDLPERVKQITYSPGPVPGISGMPDSKGATSAPASDTGGIDSRTGVYGSFYLGLVEEPEGTDCDSYGDFVVLINNRNAANPNYAQLIAFLKTDATDSFPYVYALPNLLPYYGSAESHVDLASVKAIIEGTVGPNPPRICVDFAENLHNSAEMAGIRCGFVSIDLSGSSSGHALNVFETTDRGLVYVDDTGVSNPGPSSCDKTVDLKLGREYIPKSLFPEVGWASAWDNMGAVTGIYTTWDGNWNN